MFTKFLIGFISFASALAIAPEALAATSVKTTATVAPKKIALAARKPVVKKKVVAPKLVASRTFSPSAAAAAAAATGTTTPPPGYFEALKKAQAHCVAARGNAAKLAACDAELLEAQAMLTQP